MKVIISENTDSQDLPKQKLASGIPLSEENFEALGLRDFFCDPVDQAINWEKYFSQS